jgi:hypothetical protein
MDSIEKAIIRLEHWISHNEHHQEEYGTFAAELRRGGKEEGAIHMEEMMRLTAEATEALRKTLEAIKRGA